jgi:ATP-dependent DNA ligase
MIKYSTYYYIYPPRPCNSVPTTELEFWDNGMMIAQPKLNGSNAVIFMNGKDVYFYNRHNQRMTNVQLGKDELLKLYSGEGWMVVNGEYLNKSKNDENGLVFNHKLVIFDILVHNGTYLLGTSFQDRVNLLDSLFGKNDCEKSYLYSVTENVYRVKSFTSNFKIIFEELSSIDMIEGLVCKRKSGKLEIGNTENNNTKSQIKFRKPTKNYKF